METFFASPQRSTAQELSIEIDAVVKNPVVQGLLHSISGLLAVLDECRQVVALNDSFLKMLGLEDQQDALGLRLGEVLQCIHAHDEPHGCGTTKYCSTCGAAVAMVAALALEKPSERICALTATRGESTTEICLQVRAHPIMIEGRKFILLYAQDITFDQLRAALERTFFHDINNMLTGLLGATEMLSRQFIDSKLAGIVRQSALRLANEVAIQRFLFKADLADYQVTREKTTSAQILGELENIFDTHAAKQGKHLLVRAPETMLVLQTDISLVLRVLCNMVTNALEATPAEGTVKVWVEQQGGMAVFCVWNLALIPAEVQHRIFQRSFSTKEGAGRGIGTYSMQLLGEKLLGGKVSFRSTEADGTQFLFALPL